MWDAPVAARMIRRGGGGHRAGSAGTEAATGTAPIPQGW